MPTIASFLGSYFLCHTSLNYLNRVTVEKRFMKTKSLKKIACPVTFEKTIALVMTSSGILGE